MMEYKILSISLIALIGMKGMMGEEAALEQYNLSTVQKPTNVDLLSPSLNHEDVKSTSDISSEDNKARVKRQFGYYNPYYYPRPYPVPIVVFGGGGFGRGFGGRGFGGRGFGGYGGGRGFGGFGGRGGGFGGFGGRGRG